MQVTHSTSIAPPPSSGAGSPKGSAGGASPFAKLLSAQKTPSPSKEKPAGAASRDDADAAQAEETSATPNQAQAQAEPPVDPARPVHGEPAEPTATQALAALDRADGLGDPALDDGEAPAIDVQAVAAGASRLRAASGDAAASKARAETMSDAATVAAEATQIEQQLAVDQHAQQVAEDPRHAELRSDAAKPVESSLFTPTAAVQPTARGDAAGPSAAVSVALPTPATSPEFRDALGVQVSVLARDGVQQARLHLNPADMGPISVQIALDGTHAQVNFGADSPATRQIIESGLPELAAALRDAGFTLTGGGVSQHARENAQEGGAGSGDRTGSRGNGDNGSAAPDALRGNVRVPLGAVDLYA